MVRTSFQSSSIFLAILACLLWSTAFAGIKIGLQYSSPLQFAGLRFMISGLMIFPFCRNIASDIRIAGKNFDKILWISLFQTAILYTFFYLGINKTPAAVAAIIVGGSPLFVALLAHFTTGKDPLTIRKIIALLIGFSGIVLLALVKDRNIPGHGSVIAGIVLLVTGNIAGSYGNILVSKNKVNISPVFLNALQIFMGGAIILILSFLFEESTFTHKPLPYYISLGWLSFLSAAAFSLWFVVLHRPEVKVSEINVWKFIIPVLGAILSWLIIAGEQPRWYTILGMILIAVAILIIYGKKKQ
ncbi:MAG: EamA family transporter [Bacteroidales bacterium]|nr:EamA family transporter [Bacteroidales bacterium]